MSEDVVEYQPLSITISTSKVTPNVIKSAFREMLGVPAELGLTEVLTKLGTQLDVMEPDGPNLVVVLTDLSFSTDPEKQLRASVSLPSDSPLSWLRVDLEKLIAGFAHRVAELREDAEDLEAAEEAKSEADNDSTNS